MENQTATPAQSKPPKMARWFWVGKIETKEEALKVIKDSSIAFYCLAALQIVTGYFVLGMPTIIDGVIFAILAFFLYKFKSRIVAVLLFLLSVAAVLFTTINFFGNGTGGSNIILAIILVWISIRAVQATFKLHKIEKISIGSQGEWEVNQPEEEKILSGFFRRFFAFLIDLFILGLFAFIISFIFKDFFYRVGETGWWIGFLITAIYFMIFDSKIGRGQTIGKRILKIITVDSKGEFLSIQRALVRYLPIAFLIFSNGIALSLFGNSLLFQPTILTVIYGFIVLIVGIGVIIFPIFHYQKRGLQDFLGNSFVIRKVGLGLREDFSLINNKAKQRKNRILFVIVVIILILGVLGIIFGERVIISVFPELDEVINLTQRIENQNYPIKYLEVTINYRTPLITWSGEMKGEKTKFLLISGWVKKDIFDDEARSKELAEELAGFVYNNYSNPDSLDSISVNLRSGFDIGIARFSRSKDYSFLGEKFAAIGKIQEAKLLWGSGKYGEALKKANEALEKAKTDEEKAIAHYWIGLCYYKQNKFNEAETEELSAVELDPEFGAPYVTLAAVSLERRDCEQALTYAQKAVELSPDYAWAHNDLGLAYLCLGERERGIAELRKAVELAPESYVFQDNLNRVLQQEKKKWSVIIQTDKTQYLREEKVEGFIENNLESDICLSSCHPYFPEKKNGKWWGYPPKKCDRADIIEKCIPSGTSIRFGFKIRLFTEEGGIFRLRIPVCINCEVGKEFKEMKSFYSNEFEIK